MRIIMWLTIGLFASCALSVYALPADCLLICTAVMCIFTLMALLVASKRLGFRIAFLLFLGMAIGFGWFWFYDINYVEQARRMDGITQEACIVASDFSYETDYGYAVDGKIHIAERDYKLRVYFNEEISLCPGDSVVSEFRFRYTAPKDDEFVSHYQGKGIFLTASQRGDVVSVSKGEKHWKYYPVNLAKEIKQIIQCVFPGDVYPFVKALLLGDTRDLSYAVDTDFKISGIRHIIAVSGLHVSMLYSFVEKISGKKKLLTAVIGIPALAMFAAMAGFTPSVSRACLMVGLMMIAGVFQKEYDSPTALSFASLVMLLINPMVVSSVSFQLSVGCVAGILMFQPPVQKWMDKILGIQKRHNAKIRAWISTSVSVTLGAMSITTPLSAIYFGTVSIIGVLTNLLTLWLVSIIFVGVIIVCTVSFLSVKMAVFLGSILAWPARFVILTAHVLARMPLAVVYTDSAYIVLWLIFVYVLLAVFLLGRKKGSAVMLCVCSLGLCLALFLSWVEPLMDSCRVSVLDVGQGQSILLQCNGKTFLVDCGGDSAERAADVAANKLLSQGIRKLDAVILTHCDSDHAEGIENLLTRVETEIILIPATETDFSPDDYTGQIIWVDRETKLSFASGSIRIFPPVFALSTNENSLCVLFETEKCDILITGDRSRKGELALLENYDIPDVDLLVAGHHGSQKATSEELLAAVRPETVIISVGKANVYGHPHEDVLTRLGNFGCEVYRTDIHGTIVYRR